MFEKLSGAFLGEHKHCVPYFLEDIDLQKAVSYA